MLSQVLLVRRPTLFFTSLAISVGKHIAGLGNPHIELCCSCLGFGIFQSSLSPKDTQVLTLAAVLFGQLIGQILDLAARRQLSRQVGPVAHGVELFDRLLCDEQLHEGVDEPHERRHIDEELLLQQFRIILRKNLDGLGTGRLHHGRLSQETDGFVVVDLHDLVRVVFRGDGLDGFADVE